MHNVHANGAEIPAIGLGTWRLSGEACAAQVATALSLGYRHIDTAMMYDNEAEVGAGLRASGIPRDDVFITTKIWHDQIGDGPLQASLEGSLKRLGLDHVDLALIHWPSREVPLAESIKALNDVAERRLARAIGVSNFTVSLLEEAVRLSPRPLACNQVENHPLLDQRKIMAACRAAGVALTSYCPLARGGALFEHAAVTGPAARLGVGPAQIVLRWQVQQEGVIAIPRTTKPERLAENIAVFDFELTQAEMDAISALRSAGTRICDASFAPEWDTP